MLDQPPADVVQEAREAEAAAAAAQQLAPSSGGAAPIDASVPQKRRVSLERRGNASDLSGDLASRLCAPAASNNLLQLSLHTPSCNLYARSL